MNGPIAFAADLLVRATLLILIAWLAASALRAGGTSETPLTVASPAPEPPMTRRFRTGSGESV